MNLKINPCASRVAMIGGAPSEALYEKIFALAKQGDKLPSVLFFATPKHDDEAVIADHKNAFSKITSSFEAIKVTEESFDLESLRQKLEKTDIVYVCGGNTECLINTWAEKGVSELMCAEAAKGRILFAGSSAGGIVWSAAGFNDNDDGSYWFLEGLGFVPVWFGPHYNGEKWCVGFDKAIAKQTSPELGYAACNDTAVLYDPNADEEHRYSSICGVTENRVWELKRKKPYGYWIKRSI